MRFFLCAVALLPKVGYSPLILGVSRSHSDAPQWVGTPLDERSARNRDLYLATHNSNTTQTTRLQAKYFKRI